MKVKNEFNDNNPLVIIYRKIKYNNYILLDFYFLNRCWKTIQEILNRNSYAS